MIRKCVFAFVVVAFSVGVLSGAEMFGRITKVDGNKITFQTFKKGEGKKGEFGDATVLTVAKDAKITKGIGGKIKKDDDTPPPKLDGGLTNDIFKNIDAEKGIFAKVTTDDTTKEVTAISVFLFGKGGKKNKDK